MVREDSLIGKIGKGIHGSEIGSENESENGQENGRGRGRWIREMGRPDIGQVMEIGTGNGTENGRGIENGKGTGRGTEIIEMTDRGHPKRIRTFFLHPL